jgi:hypothetical protein
VGKIKMVPLYLGWVVMHLTLGDIAALLQEGIGTSVGDRITTQREGRV